MIKHSSIPWAAVGPGSRWRLLLATLGVNQESPCNNQKHGSQIQSDEVNLGVIPPDVVPGKNVTKISRQLLGFKTKKGALV